MITDFTANTINFVKRGDDAGSSKFSSTSRGINTPDLVTISHQDTVDSKTKSGVKRHLIRFDRVALDAVTGQKYTTSAYINIVVPEQALTADVDWAVATIRAIAALVTPQDIIAKVLNDEV